MKKLEWVWFLCIPVLFLMLLCSDILYQWWIGDSVSVPFSLSVTMAVYVLFQTGGGIYMTLINGMSKVRLQLIIYFMFFLYSYSNTEFMLYDIRCEWNIVVSDSCIYATDGVGKDTVN